MSSFETRNLGLAVVLCYEWAQRPIDIFGLTWDNLDFETDTCTIKQTKKGATVYLPIDSTLKELLQKQHTDFSFQSYVLPYLRSSDKKWVPMSQTFYSQKLREIIKKLGLREGLRVGDLRATAITEMVEAGLDGVRIKPVTGHKSTNSISPYVKHTRSAAASALHDRKKNERPQEIG
jgi:integrase